MLQRFGEFFAYLLVALLAVIVPIFALTVSILARAIEDGRNKLKEESANILADIKEVQKNLDENPDLAIRELRSALRRYSWNRAKLIGRRFLLSTRAGVYYPAFCFLISLAIAISALTLAETQPSTATWLLAIAGAITGVGVITLCAVLETVYRYAAAFEPERNPFATDLDVLFPDESRIVVFPASSKQKFEIVLLNAGDYLAEKTQVLVCFPQGFVLDAGKLSTAKQTSRLYKGYLGVYWDPAGPVHSKIRQQLIPITVTMPSEKGEYVLPARVWAAQMKMKEGQLKVIVG